MYRCAKTEPPPPYAARGGCNPDYKSLLPVVASAPKLPFSLETESVQSLQARMTAGTLTSKDLTRAYLARIALTNAEGPAIQAVRAVADNGNLVGQAAKLDAERKQGKARGPLHGIPVLLDDSIDVAGMATTAGSVALQHSMPARDSNIVAKAQGNRGDHPRQDERDRARRADDRAGRQRRRRGAQADGGAGSGAAASCPRRCRRTHRVRLRARSSTRRRGCRRWPASIRATRRRAALPPRRTTSPG